MTCPICNDPAANNQSAASADRFEIKCVRCGDFSISGSALASLEAVAHDRSSRTKLSHATRKASDRKEPMRLNTDFISRLLAQPLPQPAEQADLLISWLAENSNGEGVSMTFEQHGAIVGAQNASWMMMLVGYLKEQRLVNSQSSQFLGGGFHASVTLTYQGWAHYETIKRDGVSYRKAFMAMKFGVPELDAILDSAFRPAAARAGFALSKLDDTPKAGLIDNRMRVEIRAADFVIADLTHGNLGAYWEAGFAEGLGKPVIFTCEKKQIQL